MRLLIIRHAEPDYPDDRLTAGGRAQAQDLARHLAQLPGSERPEAVFSSPMGRARQTSEPIAEALGLPYDIEPWTRELEDWIIDAQRPVHEPWGEAPAWEIHPRAVRHRPLALDWYTEPPWRRVDLGAAFETLQRDSDAFLARQGFVRDGAVYRRSTDGELHRRSIAVVCHCGFGLTWLAHLLALPPPALWVGFTLAPASVTTVEFEAVEPEIFMPHCLALGELARR